MKTLTDYNPNTSTAILLVGSPGSGKTSLILGLPGLYIFDADNNLNGPARRLAAENPTALANIKYDIGTIDDDGKEVDPFQRWTHMSNCLKRAAADPDIKVIAIDSLTAISEFIINDIKRQNRIKLDGQLEIQHWAIVQHYFKLLVTGLRTLGKTIIFTAHDSVEKDDATNTFKTFLVCPGNTKHTFSGMFSDVYETFIKEEGVGPNKTYTRMVRCVPANSNDKRGLKESLMVKPLMTTTELKPTLLRLCSEPSSLPSPSNPPTTSNLSPKNSNPSFPVPSKLTPSIPGTAQTK